MGAPFLIGHLGPRREAANALPFAWVCTQQNRDGYATGAHRRPFVLTGQFCRCYRQFVPKASGGLSRMTRAKIIRYHWILHGHRHRPRATRPGAGERSRLLDPDEYGVYGRNDGGRPGHPAFRGAVDGHENQHHDSAKKLVTNRPSGNLNPRLPRCERADQHN